MFSRFVFVLAVILLSRQSTCIAMTPEEFWQLNETEKKLIIESAINNYIEKVQNFSFAYNTENFTCELLKNRSILERNKPFFKSRTVFNRIGKSFLIHRYIWTPDKGMFMEDPDSDTYESFNAKEGNLRILTTGKHLKNQWFGIISSETSEVCKQSLLPELFDFSCRCDSFSILGHLIKNVNSWKIETSSDNSNLVIIKMDDSYCEDPNPQAGTRRVWLDISKDFFVTRQERDLKVGNVSFWCVTEVNQSLLVDDIWVPSKVLDYSCQFDSQVKGAGVEYTLLNAELGKLKFDDINVVFPNGTKVFDKIRRIEYIEGKQAQNRSRVVFYAVYYSLMAFGFFLLV